MKLTRRLSLVLLVFCALQPRALSGMFNPSFNNFHIKEIENWNLTLGPALGGIAGSALRGPGLGGGIALNKYGFSAQAEFFFFAPTDGGPFLGEARTAATLHLGLSFLIFSGGYSRMRLSSGTAAGGWHLGLEFPLPLTRGRRDSLMRFLRLYYRPTWIRFPGGREVFHEIGIGLRFRILLED